MGEVPLATRGHSSGGPGDDENALDAERSGPLPVTSGLWSSLDRYEDGHAPPDHGGGPEPRTASARSLWSLRFNARGELYQAFARFDLNVLQPALGGPCRARAGHSS